jgi:tetratricopeptide (TPR) repeat protein
LLSGSKYLCLVALLLCHGLCAAEAPKWADKHWSHRYVLDIPGGARVQGNVGVSAWVHLPVGADLTGRSLRVSGSDGKALPFAVAWASPEGRCLVTFQTRRAGEPHAVYFGNKAAKPLRSEWPRAGLFHYTMPIPRGLNFRNAAKVQEAVKAKEGLFGAAFRSFVHEGYNPFGPQKNYIGVYEGFIEIDEPGTYAFAPLSEHSAFIYVDGKLVVQHPGPHSIHANRFGKWNGTIDLSMGTHRFTFVHLSYARPMRCGAAWSVPGKRGFSLMPATAFTPLLKARVRRVERQDGAAHADFLSTPKAYCEAGGAAMLAVSFTAKGSDGKDVYWEFGDGLTSRSTTPTHVYFQPGVYDVKLTIRTVLGKRASIVKKQRVEPIQNDLDFRQRKLDMFQRLVAGYEWENMDAAPLYGAWQFCVSQEMHNAAARALVLLGRKRKELEPAARFAVLMALAEACQQAGEVQAAGNWLAEALAFAEGTHRAGLFPVRKALCDHMFYYVGAPAEARRAYEKLRVDYARGSAIMLRILLIRIGDTYRTEGKLEKALAVYEQAERDAQFTPSKPRALMVGSAKLEVQAYMKRGEAEEAGKRLESMLWYYPSLRLDGDATLLRVRAALAAEKFGEAKKQADTFIAFSKDRNHLPPVHMAAAEACLKLGEKKAAAAHYRKVVEEYREAPEVQAATAALEGM